VDPYRCAGWRAPANAGFYFEEPVSVIFTADCADERGLKTSREFRE